MCKHDVKRFKTSTKKKNSRQHKNYSDILINAFHFYLDQCLIALNN